MIYCDKGSKSLKQPFSEQQINAGSSPSCRVEAFYEVRLYGIFRSFRSEETLLALTKFSKKDAHPPRIHRGFIGLCDNAGKRTHPCAARRANPPRGGSARRPYRRASWFPEVAGLSPKERRGNNAPAKREGDSGCGPPVVSTSFTLLSRGVKKSAFFLAAQWNGQPPLKKRS